MAKSIKIYITHQLDKRAFIENFRDSNIWYNRYSNVGGELADAVILRKLPFRVPLPVSHKNHT